MSCFIVDVLNMILWYSLWRRPGRIFHCKTLSNSGSSATPWRTVARQLAKRSRGRLGTARSEQVLSVCIPRVASWRVDVEKSNPFGTCNLVGKWNSPVCQTGQSTFQFHHLAEGATLTVIDANKINKSKKAHVETFAANLFVWINHTHTHTSSSHHVSLC